MSINILSQHHFSPIFYYLQDRDIKALGCTSKKMHGLVTEELEARDRKTEQLASGFVITRTFNIQHISQARLFPIGDKHGDEDCIRDRSALIGFLSRRAPIFLLVEGVPSMEKRTDIFQITFTAQGARSYYLIQTIPTEPAFKANIYTVGWDFCSDESRSLLMRQKEILNERLAIKIRLSLQTSLLSSLLPIALGTNRIWKNLGYERNQVLDLMKNPRQYIQAMDQVIPLFSNQAHRFINDNAEKGKTNQKLLDSFNSYEILRSSSEIKDKPLKEAYDEIECKNKECIRREFPKRIVSMEGTLQEVDANRLASGIQEYYIVVIGGTDHLEARKQDVEYDLSPLYKELENHKAAILLPSSIVSMHYQGHSFPKNMETK